MQAAIDRVMKTYGMIANLTIEQERAAREKVTSILAEKPDTDETALAIEGLRYLRSVKDLLDGNRVRSRSSGRMSRGGQSTSSQATPRPGAGRAHKESSASRDSDLFG